jgi:hypothetical protein
MWTCVWALLGVLLFLFGLVAATWLDPKFDGSTVTLQRRAPTGTSRRTLLP